MYVAVVVCALWWRGRGDAVAEFSYVFSPIPFPSCSPPPFPPSPWVLSWLWLLFGQPYLWCVVSMRD